MSPRYLLFLHSSICLSTFRIYSRYLIVRINLIDPKLVCLWRGIWYYPTDIVTRLPQGKLFDTASQLVINSLCRWLFKSQLKLPTPATGLLWATIRLRKPEIAWTQSVKTPLHTDPSKIKEQIGKSVSVSIWGIEIALCCVWCVKEWLFPEKGGRGWLKGITNVDLLFCWEGSDLEWISVLA